MVVDARPVGSHLVAVDNRLRYRGGRREHAMRLQHLLDADPAEVARHLSHSAHAAGAEDWVRRLAEELERQGERDALHRWLRLWGLSDAEAGRLFGVTRQAIGKWRANGVPLERAGVLADLAATTDLLAAYLRHDRIPAVVRRPADVLDGRSMLDLVGEGRTTELLVATRRLFDLRNLDAA
jgi:hypothetical protein